MEMAQRNQVRLKVETTQGKLQGSRSPEAGEGPGQCLPHGSGGAAQRSLDLQLSASELENKKFLLFGAIQVSGNFL
jgi:hypothetical protein